MEDEQVAEETNIDLTPQLSRGMKPLTIVGSLLSVLALLTVVLIFVDPLNLDLLARLRGDHDPTIRVMPMDTIVYVQLNVLEANVTELKQLGESFSSALPDDMEEEESLDFTEQELGGMEITPADFLSWMGVHAGVGVLDVTVEDGITTDTSWLAALEVRDERDARAFMDKLASEWERTREVAPTTETIQDMSVMVLTEDGADNALYIALYDGLMLMSGNTKGLEMALETANGRSLAENTDYIDTISQLSTEPFLTTYVAYDSFSDLAMQAIPEGSFDQVETPIDIESFSTALKGFVARFSIIDDGIAIEYGVSYDATQLTEEQKKQFESVVEDLDGAVSQMPNDTIAYMVLPNLSALWENGKIGLLETMEEEELEETLDLVAEQLGIRLDTDLLQLLDQETSLVVRAKTMENVPTFTVTAVLGTSQADILTQNMDTFRTALTNPETGMGTATEETFGDATVYELETFLSPGASLAYSVYQDSLLFTDDAEGVTEFAWDGTNAITANPSYQQASNQLGTTPIFFLDLALINETFTQDDEQMEEFSDFFGIFSHVSSGILETEGDAVMAKIVIGFNHNSE